MSRIYNGIMNDQRKMFSPIAIARFIISFVQDQSNDSISSVISEGKKVSIQGCGHLKGSRTYSHDLILRQSRNMLSLYLNFCYTVNKKQIYHLGVSEKWDLASVQYNELASLKTFAYLKSHYIVESFDAQYLQTYRMVKMNNNGQSLITFIARGKVEMCNIFKLGTSRPLLCFTLS